MGRNVLQHGIVKLDAVVAEAVGGAGVDVLVGSEQIHGGKVGGPVPAAAVPHADFHIFHALAVSGVQKEGAGKAADDRVQLRVQVRTAGKGFHDRLLIAHHTGLNAFRQPGTAVGLTASPLSGVHGTQLAVHVLRCVLKCVDIQEPPPFLSDGGPLFRGAVHTVAVAVGCLDNIPVVP